MHTQRKSWHTSLRVACRIVSMTVLTMVVCLIVVRSAVAANGPRMIEVSDGDHAWTGMIVAKSAEDCFIMDRFGKHSQVPISNLKTFKVVAESFRPASQSEVRRMLEAEFGTGYEIATSKHYVVCGDRGRSRVYAAMFESIYQQIQSFYFIRGFRTSEPETPLIAVVLRNQAEFKKYCEKDQVAWSEGLRGYYLRSSNRVALYDTPDLIKTVQLAPDSHPVAQDESRIACIGPTANESNPFGESSTFLTYVGLASTVSGETADTIIHETTHQVGFNIGIHSRIGDTPSWTLEGLATVLEAPGVRTRSNSGLPKTKLNSERLDWFKREYATRRQPGDLAKLIASDEMFRTQVLDAYSASWGITWFLTENPARARMFAKYLRTVAERDPLKAYSPEERLADFQSVFGDISRLEVDYVRALDQL